MHTKETGFKKLILCNMKPQLHEMNCLKQVYKVCVCMYMCVCVCVAYFFSFSSSNIPQVYLVSINQVCIEVEWKYLNTENTLICPDW
jgi:hypothetical protein